MTAFCQTRAFRLKSSLRGASSTVTAAKQMDEQMDEESRHDARSRMRSRVSIVCESGGAVRERVQVANPGITAWSSAMVTKSDEKLFLVLGESGGAVRERVRCHGVGICSVTKQNQATTCCIGKPFGVSTASAFATVMKSDEKPFQSLVRMAEQCESEFQCVEVRHHGTGIYNCKEVR